MGVFQSKSKAPMYVTKNRAKGKLASDTLQLCCVNYSRVGTALDSQLMMEIKE